MNKTIQIFSVALILWASSLVTHASELTRPNVTVFSEVRVFDGYKSISAATVIVRGSKITEILTKDQNIEIPTEAEIISGDGMTLLPGLIDSHTHIFSRAMLVRALDFGVTTVMDMFSTNADFMQAIKSEDREGIVFDRADMLSAGIGMTVEGGAWHTVWPNTND